MPTLSMYVITWRTLDKGDRYVVREHVVGADDYEIARYCTTHHTLEKARAAVPTSALVQVPRSDDDDPVIVETWL